MIPDTTYDAISARAVPYLVGYGSHADLPDPVSVLRSDGEARDDDPALAATVSDRCGQARPAGFTQVMRLARFGHEGAPTSGCSGSTGLFALRRAGYEAAALSEAMRAFSDKQTAIRPAEEAPRDVVVVALGEGRAFNAIGNEAVIEIPSATRP